MLAIYQIATGVPIFQLLIVYYTTIICYSKSCRSVNAIICCIPFADIVLYKGFCANYIMSFSTQKYVAID